MLSLGIPALIEFDTVEQHCQLCRELGLNFIELNTNFPTQQLHLLDAEALRTLAQQYHIFYTIHLNDEMPVADFNPTVAKGYCDAVLETIEFARRIGAKVLNMHISEGARYTRPDGVIYFYQAYLDDYLARIRVFRDLCEAAIGDSGIRICMENSKAYLPFQRRALDVLLESSAFALTLDIGHSYCSNYADEAWILHRSDRLVHMHLHDAKNSTQDHIPLGEGELDLKKYLTLAIDRNCTAVVEVKTAQGLRDSLVWIKENDYA